MGSWRILFRGLCIVSVLGMAACERPAGSQDSLVVKSADWETILAGEYLIENNVWGKGSISDYKQSIFYDPETGRMGWQWQWPEVGYQVKAYPEIIFGKKPWEEGRTTSRLPRRLREADLTIEFTYKIQASGSGNTSFDLWITSDESGASDKVIREIMIWTDRFNMALPEAQFKKSVHIAGITYSLIAVPDFEVMGNKWLYICFTAATPVHRGELRLMDFFSLLNGEGLVSWDDYLASIEFGNEIVHGFGKTSVEKYLIR